jgi:hypothetical protein
MGRERRDRARCARGAGAAAAMLALLIGAPAWSAELDLFAGPLHSGAGPGTAWGWGVDFRQELSDHLAAGFVWLNEGHYLAHHRDGQALELWWRSSDATGLVLEAGIGPYLTDDTAWSFADNQLEDQHHLALLASVALRWNFDPQHYAEVRLNRVEARSTFDTTMISATAGYRFGADLTRARAAQSAWSDAYEADGFLGKVVLNSAPAASAIAGGVGARATVAEHVAVSATVLLSGSLPDDWRSGIALQAWLEQALSARWAVGAGIGGLVDLRPITLPGADSGARLSGLVAITAAYALSPTWRIRAAWDRRVTRSNQDCDVILIGLGRGF